MNLHRNPHELCMDLCFRGEGLIHGLWDQPMYSLRELGKGALFWEEAALQVHHLATVMLKIKGPFFWWGQVPATTQCRRLGKWNVSWILPYYSPLLGTFVGCTNCTNLQSSLSEYYQLCKHKQNR